MSICDWLRKWWKPDWQKEPCKDVDTPHVWSLTHCERRIEPDVVFRTLADLLPAGSSMRLEGVSIARDVESLLTDHPADVILERRRDTIWPRSKLFHVPATHEMLVALAEMCGGHARPEICDHLFIYQADTVMLSWPDFLDRTTLMISDHIDEGTVARFVGAIGCGYECTDNPCGPAEN